MVFKRTEDDESRFWSKVEKTDGCWIWKGTDGGRGYGQFCSYPEPGKQRTWRAHRFAFFLQFGEEPPPLLMHECDNRACVRQGNGHVIPGTQKQNIAHAVETRRMAKGVRNASAKMTEASVLDIRERYAKGETQQKLANEYGVSQVCISLVIRGKKWKHVGGPIKT